MSRTPPHIALVVATVAFVVSIALAAAAVGVADARPAGPAAAISAARLSGADSQARVHYVAPVLVSTSDPLTGFAPWYAVA